MSRKNSRFTPAVSYVNETLEGRLLLSGIAPSPGSTSHLQKNVAEVATRPGRTQTKLSVNAGTLGQPITFNVTVRTAASAGAPTGTVEIIDHGNVIATLTVSPTTSSNPRFAFSDATDTLTPPPGGTAYFFGKHPVTAAFIPTGAFSTSTGRDTFTVSKPVYTTLSGGVKISTIVQGSGPQIQGGQTASMLYTGYLAKNGHVFDDSLDHGGAPFSFTVGVGEVIPGFDEGTVGMQVGESRIVMIPPAEGYGATPTGSIPAHSTLVFVLTLESIS